LGANLPAFPTVVIPTKVGIQRADAAAVEAWTPTFVGATAKEERQDHHRGLRQIKHSESCAQRAFAAVARLDRRAAIAELRATGADTAGQAVDLDQRQELGDAGGDLLALRPAIAGPHRREALPTEPPAPLEPRSHARSPR
jgi:hypothetical protein